MAGEVGRIPSRLCRPLLAVCTAFFLLAGCAVTPARPRDYSKELEAARRAVARLHHIITTARPTAQARAQVKAVWHELDQYPSPLAIRALRESLREGEDKYHAVVLEYLRRVDAEEAVPVRIRARVMTFWAVQTILGKGIRRAEQADVLVQRIRESCEDDPAEVGAAWVSLLEAKPSHALYGGRKVDLTPAAQGVAILGLVRTAQRGDLSGVFARVCEKRVTASPLLLAQCLLQLSAPRLKQNLLQWLGGPLQAQRAAVIAADFAQLRAPSLKVAPTAKQINAARAWAKLLPDRAAAPHLALEELMRLSELAAKHKKPPAPVTEALRRAAAYLAAPSRRDPLGWYKQIPPTDKLRALQRLVGIDWLVNPILLPAAPR